MHCEFCNNCGGEWVETKILRKRVTTFKPCPYCRKQETPKTGQQKLEVGKVS